jgi:uncharacterized protein
VENFLVLGFLVFTSSILSGTFGMAGGLALHLGLSFFYPVEEMIAIHAFAQLVSNGSRVVMGRSILKPLELLPFTFGIAMAAVFVFAFGFVPNLPTALILGGLIPILVFGAEWIRKKPLPMPVLDSKLGGFFAGISNGLIQFAGGVSGAFLDLFFQDPSKKKEWVVLNKAAAQVITHFARIAFFGFALQAFISLPNALICGVTAISGNTVGKIILKNTSESFFRKGTRFFVLLLATASLVRAVYLTSL